MPDTLYHYTVRNHDSVWALLCFTAETVSGGFDPRLFQPACQSVLGEQETKSWRLWVCLNDEHLALCIGANAHSVWMSETCGPFIIYLRCCKMINRKRKKVLLHKFIFIFTFTLFNLCCLWNIEYLYPLGRKWNHLRSLKGKYLYLKILNS